MTIKSTASEEELNALHSALARLLRMQLEATSTITDEDGNEIEMSLATPAVMNAAIKFLKDNNITTTIEQNNDMKGVADLLRDKPQRGRAQLRSVAAKKAALE